MTIRLCHIQFSYYPWNSAPYEYTHKLAEKGYDVTMIALAQTGQPADAIEDGVRVRRLNIPRRFFPQNMLRFARQVKHIARYEDFDIFHVYQTRWVSMLPLIVGRPQGRWLLDIRSGNIKGGLRSTLANHITAFEARSYDHVVTLDSAVGQRVLGKRRNFDVVPLGADLVKFDVPRDDALRQKLGFTQEDQVLVFTGRLDHLRRLETLIEGFTRAWRVNADLRLLLVGDGNARATLESVSRDLGVERAVVFAGQVPYREIQHYVKIADVGVSYVPATREYAIQPPLKTAEFMSAGLPTLATDMPGNRRFIEHGVTGWLFQDDAQSLAHQILSVCNQKPIWSQVVVQAKQAIQRYDWKTIVMTDLLPVYQRMLDMHQVGKLC